MRGFHSCIQNSHVPNDLHLELICNLVWFKTTVCNFKMWNLPTFERPSFEGVRDLSLLTEVSKPLPKLYIWKLKEVYSLIQYGLLNMELPCIGCSIIQSLFPYYINLNLNFPEMVDCEQSLLFPPVIVYRVQKRRPHREWGERRTGERERKRTFHPILCVACASALGTRLQEGKGGLLAVYWDGNHSRRSTIWTGRSFKNLKIRDKCTTVTLGWTDCHTVLKLFFVFHGFQMCSVLQVFNLSLLFPVYSLCNQIHHKMKDFIIPISKFGPNQRALKATVHLHVRMCTGRPCQTFPGELYLLFLCKPWGMQQELLCVATKVSCSTPVVLGKVRWHQGNKISLRILYPIQTGMAAAWTCLWPFWQDRSLASWWHVEAETTQPQLHVLGSSVDLNYLGVLCRLLWHFQGWPCRFSANEMQIESRCVKHFQKEVLKLCCPLAQLFKVRIHT